MTEVNKKEEPKVEEKPKQPGLTDIMASELRLIFQMKDFGHKVNGLFSTNAEKSKLLDETCKQGAEKMLETLIRKVLADPVAVHMNMLRGAIAKPSFENIIHLYGAQNLQEALIRLEEKDANG